MPKVIVPITPRGEAISSSPESVDLPYPTQYPIKNGSARKPTHSHFLRNAEYELLLQHQLHVGILQSRTLHFGEGLVHRILLIN